MNFGGIGEFIYSFHLPGVILIGVLAGIVIYTINKILIRSMKNGNFLLVSFILANPIWFMPWNIGINDYFGRKFIFAFLGFYLLIWILTTLNRIRISKNV
jgi:glucose dehydrogenase